MPGQLTVKGKGGLVRQIPSTPEIDGELRKLLGNTPRGGKLFVSPAEKTHRAMSKFLYDNKGKIQDPAPPAR